jgi:dTDP-4-dehydrorhamnose reductase
VVEATKIRAGEKAVGVPSIVRILITGVNGKIGSRLALFLSPFHKVTGTTRNTLDLLEPGDLSRFGTQDKVYLCAASTRFIDCERDPNAYRVNVDAQLEIASHFKTAIYLSSEAVESALHTAYGQHKALCEVGLRAVCKPVIARIGRVTDENLPKLLNFLGTLLDAKPGVYRWGI